MARRYYDEDEDEFIEGEWLDQEPRGIRTDELHGERVRVKQGAGQQRGFSKKFTIRLDPRFTFGGGGRGHPGQSQGMSTENRGFSFSEMEKKHLFFATLMLTSAFMLLFHGGLYAGLQELFVWPHFLFILVPSLVAVITGFLTHEMGHKFAAQKMGYWAEFRYSRSGLFMALIFALFGFIIAAPGAVMIYGRLSRKENGITSLAGPAINTIWATLFLGAIMIMRFTEFTGHNVRWDLLEFAPWISTGQVLLWNIFYYGFFMNVIFAAFNLLPIRFLGLDGYKILDWNFSVYFLFVAVITVFIYICGYLDIFLGTTHAAIFAIICLVMGIYRKMR
ncbi:MAG: site-2 protease family protein [Candidatus Thermoplasmatota archaeon]|nr:site-2 protease family protein [Candidatus Thermoplasmatota archaeon]MDP7264549.1 site-2 protease family protein [Candidatus Thermoplasmatota archaeon]